MGDCCYHGQISYISKQLDLITDLLCEICENIEKKIEKKIEKTNDKIDGPIQKIDWFMVTSKSGKHEVFGYPIGKFLVRNAEDVEKVIKENDIHDPVIEKMSFEQIMEINKLAADYTDQLASCFRH